MRFLYSDLTATQIVLYSYHHVLIIFQRLSSLPEHLDVRVLVELLYSIMYYFNCHCFVTTYLFNNIRFISRTLPCEYVQVCFLQASTELTVERLRSFATAVHKYFKY